MSPCILYVAKPNGWREMLSPSLCFLIGLSTSSSRSISWKEDERVWYVRKHVDKSFMVLPIGM
uniref:Uncharacterized protein MANES_12G084400 n=1 Tax=Rhizophora mucronata TaxID=61149 RepID=A0A2P2LYU7_RHIMU